MSRKLPFILACLFAVGLSLPAHAADELRRAITAQEQGRHDEARALLAPLAAAGDAEAQLRLGLIFYHGHGVAENEKRAVDLFSKSAAQGNVEAMYQLGNAFAFGHSTQSMVADADVEAAKWYFAAASAGNADAQYALGLLFAVGKGVNKDLDEATAWMTRAAKAGHADARMYIGDRKN